MPEELDEPVFLSWEEYWSIAVRRRWYILLPLFLVWLAIWGVSWLLPATYQSESLILVEQQKVPDQYVVPNVTSNLQERLQNLTEQILSHAPSGNNRETSSLSWSRWPRGFRRPGRANAERHQD